ncbi:MAG: OsmC family protein [candidate division Zixibacteria bacterium]
MVSVSMSWQGDMRFEGENSFGHTIITDGAKSSGGGEAGFKPTELLLYGIAGCTGIDIVSIMKKMRQEMTSLEIRVSGHQNDDYPRPFHTVEIKFIASGPKVDRDKLAQAIELSESKYCVVSQTIEKEAKVSSSFEIIHN